MDLSFKSLLRTYLVVILWDSSISKIFLKSLEHISKPNLVKNVSDNLTNYHCSICIANKLRKHRVFARCQNWPNPRPDMNYLLSLLTLQPTAAADLPKHVRPFIYLSLFYWFMAPSSLAFAELVFYWCPWTATRVCVGKKNVFNIIYIIIGHFYPSLWSIGKKFFICI